MAESIELKKRKTHRSGGKENPVIIIQNEDVTTLQATMCVSTIDISKRLKKGRLSSCVLKKAGPTIQQEVDARPENLQRCHRIRTSPGQLTNFRSLMFLCLLPWADEQCRDDLFQVVSEALSVASKDELDCVAFPALGMGGLRYPPHEVSMAMLRAIANFYVENPDSKVRTVHIAAFGQNDYIMQEFAESAINFCKVFNKKLSEFGTKGRMLHVENLKDADKLTSIPKTKGSQCPKGELFKVKITPTSNVKTCDSAFRNAYNEVKLQFTGR